MIQSTLLMISATDIILIVVLAIFFFGGKKIPELAKGIGKGIREFKDSQAGSTSNPNDPTKKA
jgi:sec-independent protein translocase protein TatA